MLSLKLPLSKKSDAAPALAPNWHPNFRNFERLPDTKVVRTTIFVNTAAGAAALALLAWVVYGEYRLNNLSVQINDAKAQIASNAKANAEALRLTKIFEDEDKKLAEAAAFVQVPVTPFEFIEIIGQTLPKEISIQFADVRMPADPKGQIFVLRGVVAGSRDQAAGTASSYVEALKTHPKLGAIFDPITLDKLTPDGSTGFMAFEISLKVKTEAKK